MPIIINQRIRTLLNNPTTELKVTIEDGFRVLRDVKTKTVIYKQPLPKTNSERFEHYLNNLTELEYLEFLKR
jgi:hypothetical protein